MRRERSFLILLVLAVALGAYIYFVERKRPPSDAPEETPKVFEEVEASKIEELLVVSDERTRLKKADGRWQIVEPIAVDADEGEASSLASSLATLDRLEIIDENPSDLTEFGLDPPQGEVAFRTEGSSELTRLLLGNRAPTGSGMYAKRPDEPRLLLIPAYVDTTFRRSTFELRDKSVLKIERDQVDGLELMAGNRAIKLSRASGDWRLTEPVAARADFGAAEGIAGRLATARMQSVISSDASDAATLRKHGLDRPAVTVNVLAGSSRATLEVGGVAGDGARYARDTARPLIFTVEESLVTELEKPVAEFRRKDPFEFRPFNARRLEIARDGETLAFEKREEDGEGDAGATAWRQTAPSERDVDVAKIDALLSALSNMRADSWTDTSPPAGRRWRWSPPSMKTSRNG